MLNMDVNTSTVLPPRVVDYADYHDFVRDFFKFKKSQNARFSYRRFAGLAGIKSSNFLLLVMKKERRLSIEMARSVAKPAAWPASHLAMFASLP